jgi:hypothetical protein
MRSSIESLVMSAIANDYEDFDMVVSEVTVWAKRAGLSATSAEIFTNLEKLIEKGMAQAYRLSSTSPPEVISLPCLDEMPDDCYFFLTAEGKASLGD